MSTVKPELRQLAFERARAALEEIIPDWLKDRAIYNQTVQEASDAAISAVVDEDLRDDDNHRHAFELWLADVDARAAAHKQELWLASLAARVQYETGHSGPGSWEEADLSTRAAMIERMKYALAAVENAKATMAAIQRLERWLDEDSERAILGASTETVAQP